jgi:hypothetical protein
LRFLQILLVHEQQPHGNYTPIYHTKHPTKKKPNMMGASRTD